MLFVDDKGGDIWIDKHCYDYAILASPRDIWTCAKVCIMPWVDILSCEENAKLARIFQMCASCNKFHSFIW